MKNLTFLLFVVLALFLQSCSSEQEDEILNVGGTFHVVTYDLDNSTSNLRATPIGSSGVKSLLYLVYNSNGDLVKSRIWTKGQNISLVNDTLAQGKYNVVFYGSSVEDKDANVDPVSMYFLNHLNTDTTYFFLKNPLNTDMFYCNTNLTVGNVDIKQRIVIPRIVGKVEVLITDAGTIPTDVKSIQIALAPDHPTVFGLQGEQTIFTQADTESQYFMPVTALMTRAQFLTATASNKPLSFMMLANTDLYNKKGVKPDLCFIVERVSGKKQIVYIKENLLVTRNQTLQLRGNLFGKFDSSVDNSNINIEDQWGTKVIETIL